MTATPRHHTPRSNRDTLGAGVAAIARAKGRPLMPWQRDGVDVALEVDPATGRLWYELVIVTVQRQAGKTTLESDVGDHRCLIVPRARCWYTAQTGKDASAWMRDEHFPSLEAAWRVFGRPGSPSAKYTRSKRAGQEGIDWRHGSTFRVFPPLRDALHGRQSDLVFVDEAWSISADQGADLRQAIRPTMATRPGSQLWPVSTMGDDGSVWWDSYVELGLASLGDPNSRVAFIDYGIADTVDPENIDAVAAAHPAYGFTIDRRALEAARADFRDDVAGWARAYGNRPTRSRVAAFPPAVWAAGARPRPTPPARYGLGIDATPDGSRVAVVAAWRDAAGVAYVEPLLVGRPDRSTPAMIADLAQIAGCRPVADRAAFGVLSILDAVAELGVDVERVALADYAAACLTFRRGIIDGVVTHPDDVDLNSAVDVATTRTVGDGGQIWARRSSSGSIAELVAATLSIRSADTLPAPPRRPAVGGARRV